MSKRVLALDLGASGGRAILATYENGKITLSEVHRFSNDPVFVNGTLYWDILRLLHEIKQGMLKASHAGGYDSIGIDTWGVDFGLLDAKGNLLENPVHYRDKRTAGKAEKAFKTLSREAIYNATGIQFMDINTLYQMLALQNDRPELLEKADRMLFIPDLLNYFLSGVQASEYSIASTSQMLDAEKRQWSNEIFDAFSLPMHLLKPVVPTGTVLGVVSEEICQELGIQSAKVIAVAGHDTACAVVATPALEKDFIFISCGTWSLFGTELDEPLIDEKSTRYNMTNEGGYGGNIRFLKNIIGTWLIQECRRQWKREGLEYSYAELETMALACEPFQSLIDPDDPSFVAPGNIPERIRNWCAQNGQKVPETIGQVVRCIYESLALKYRKTFENVMDCTGKEYGTIHLVGGGAKDGLLCQMTASSCNRKVMAGPIEATALGNCAVQLMALGELPDLQAARRVILEAEAIKTYLPVETEVWNQAWERFKLLLNL